MMRRWLLLALLCLAACQQVEPWQRATLARPEMAVQPLAREAARNLHTRQSREAGSPAGAAAGGGCGCY